MHPAVVDHLDVVERVISRVPPSFIEREDLRHEMVIALDRALHQYDPEKAANGDIKGYLGRKLVWARTSLLRDGSKMSRTQIEAVKNGEMEPIREVSLDALAENGRAAVAPDEEFHDPVEADRVREAVCQLPPRERRFIVERFWGGCSIAAIAEELGITEGHGHHVQRRAMWRLRRLLS